MSPDTPQPPPSLGGVRERCPLCGGMGGHARGKRGGVFFDCPNAAPPSMPLESVRLWRTDYESESVWREGGDPRVSTEYVAYPLAAAAAVEARVAALGARVEELEKALLECESSCDLSLRFDEREIEVQRQVAATRGPTVDGVDGVERAIGAFNRSRATWNNVHRIILNAGLAGLAAPASPEAKGGAGA